MPVIDLLEYKLRTNYLNAAGRPNVLPAEHPATTLRRDALDRRPRLPVRYPSLWDCRRCRHANPITLAWCGNCGGRRGAPGDPR